MSEVAIANDTQETSHDHTADQDLWKGGKSPFKASYGKVMMWFFLISDTFTFAAFLLAYGSLRFMNVDTWPNPADVFQSIPAFSLMKEGAPLVFVSFMTFVLILSSVTMVRAVQEGMMMNRKGVIKWLIPTIVGGLVFLACQYFEWTHLMHDNMTMTSTLSMTLKNGEVITAPLQFGQLFYCITGFHGMHVAFGVGLNIWLLIQTTKGHFDRIGHYEMVEKIGLFWHFVDLVWVYVFLCFYLL